MKRAIEAENNQRDKGKKMYIKIEELRNKRGKVIADVKG